MPYVNLLDQEIKRAQLAKLRPGFWDKVVQGFEEGFQKGYESTTLEGKAKKAELRKKIAEAEQAEANQPTAQERKEAIDYLKLFGGLPKGREEETLKLITPPGLKDIFKLTPTVSDLAQPQGIEKLASQTQAPIDLLGASQQPVMAEPYPEAIQELGPQAIPSPTKEMAAQPMMAPSPLPQITPLPGLKQQPTIIGISRVLEQTRRKATGNLFVDEATGETRLPSPEEQAQAQTDLRTLQTRGVAPERLELSKKRIEQTKRFQAATQLRQVETDNLTQQIDRQMINSKKGIDVLEKTKTLTPQIFNEIQQDLSQALTGAGNATEGKLHRTEFNTYQQRLAGIIQNVTNNPQDINSPAIVNQVKEVLARLNATLASWRSDRFKVRANVLRDLFADDKEIASAILKRQASLDAASSEAAKYADSILHSKKDQLSKEETLELIRLRKLKASQKGRP